MSAMLRVAALFIVCGLGLLVFSLADLLPSRHAPPSKEEGKLHVAEARGPSELPEGSPQNLKGEVDSPQRLEGKAKSPQNLKGEVDSQLCAQRFKLYEPSAFERSWSDDIEDKRLQACQLLAEQTNQTVPLMTASYVWSQKLPARKVPPSSIELFSRLVYEDSCTHEQHAELIEPLFGMLRDPFTICNNVPSSVPRELFQPMDNSPLQSKAWFLSAVHAPVVQGKITAALGSPRIRQAPKRFLLDLGSNLFSSWGAQKEAYSTAYFFSMFKDAGVPFDRIFAYEHEKLDPHQVWEAVPKEAVPVYTLINHGVESTVDARFNPWNLLTSVATPDDFVVVKLDIDTPAIEQSLVEQLMSNQTLADFIDEMYFEHHVYIPEMDRYWRVGQQSSTTLTTSYKWFSRLRDMGIRMHSWP